MTVHDMFQFYSDLLAQQEPLGAEFEKILYDNLWELYDAEPIHDMFSQKAKA